MIRKILATASVFLLCLCFSGCEGGKSESVNPRVNADGTPKQPRPAPGPKGFEKEPGDGGG